MLNRTASVAVIALITLLAGCSYLKYPNVHKVTILQGNIINQQMIDQLQPGMTRAQVRYILGTPLIADSFHQDRWDYYYSVKVPGYDERRERISIFFSNDQLSHFSGDYLPSDVAAAMEAAGAAGSPAATATFGGEQSDESGAAVRALPVPPDSVVVEKSTVDESTPPAKPNTE